MERSSAGQCADARRHVFVYGTLRRGGSNDITRLRPAPTWVGMASISGTLYDCGPYPGVVLRGDGRVTGEVYAIDAALELRLNEIEGISPRPSGEYAKRHVPVTMGSQVLACLVYEMSESHVGTTARVVAEGDWIAHLRD